MIYAERTTWTATDLVALPDDGYHYELVKGRLVQMPPAGGDHGEASAGLGADLVNYARTHGGHAYAAETGFNLTLPGERDETILAPDASYIREESVPRDPHGFVGRAPDLAVEVASPTQFRPEMEGKGRLWLSRGCRMVWLVWPATRTIEVWLPGHSGPQQTLGPGDTLDGGDIVPAFRVPVSRIFPAP